MQLDAVIPRPTLSDVLTELGLGRPVVVTGTRGGPVMLCAAEETTPDQINLMATHARGLVGLVMTHKRAAELGLDLQPRSGRPGAPLYTRSIEAAKGTTTGISTEDRARTIRIAATGGKGDVITPGHIFPQVSDGHQNGVAETAIRLLAASGGQCAATICAILDDRGEVADTPTAQALARRLGLATVDMSQVRALTGPDAFW